MKFLSTIVALGGLLGTSAFAGPIYHKEIVETGFPYLSVYGGWSWFDDWTSTSSYGGQFNTSSDSGWNAGVAFGYQLPDNRFGAPRIELDYNHRQADVSSNPITTSFALLVPASVSGDISASSLMVNVIQDFDIGRRIRPYVGGGIGAVFVDPNFTSNITGARNPAVYDDDSVFGYQFLAGAEYAVNDRVSTYVEYRVLGFGDANLGHEFNSLLINGTYPALLSDDNWVQTVNIGVRIGLK